MVGFMCGGHHASVGVAYHDWGKGGALVDDRSSDSGEVGGATPGVGNSNVWLGTITDGGPMVLMLGDEAAIKQ
jgi:hypothetical protein